MTGTEAHEFMARYFQAALQEDDLDVFAALYAEDGVLEDPVGNPPLRGRAAIREFLRGGRAVIARAVPTVHAVIPCGDECAVQWSVEVHTVRGKTLTYAGIGIFMFDAAGRLRHVKEYYDATQLAQMFAEPGA